MNDIAERYGLNLSSRDTDGNNMLHQLAFNSNPFVKTMILYFIKKGLNPNEKNNDGKKHTDIASERKDTTVLEYILRNTPL